jgi:hypothetical protein
MRIPVNFARHSYEASAGTLSTQQLINLYPEVIPTDDKTPLALIGTSGETLFTTVGNGPLWGAEKLGTLVYIVSGDNVYTVDSTGTTTDLGSIGTVSATVDMATDGETVTIVNSGAGWVADSSSLTQITDGDFLTPSSVTTLDGFNIFTQSATDTFFKSSQLDALTYDALDFDVEDGESDILVKAQSLQKELVLFGADTTGFWSNVGGGGFPYQRTGGFIERGCEARDSVAKEDNTLYWLADDLSFYRLIGYTPERISTHAIEEKIRKMTTTSDAVSFIYTENGHKFYCTTFPTELVTICFDIATAAWHERQSFEKGRWNANCFVKAFGKNLVGDFENSNLYELDLDIYTENTGTLQRVARSQVVNVQTNRFTVDEFLLDIEVGVGLNTGQGSDPEVILRFSDDGGKTWSNEKKKKLGKIGEYRTQLKWQRLGQSGKEGRVFEITISDPVRVRIGQAYAIISVGDH